MKTGAQTSQSRQFFAGEADSRLRRLGAPAHSAHSPKLMEQLHQALRSRHYSRCTERSTMHESGMFMLPRLFLSPVAIASYLPESLATGGAGKRDQQLWGKRCVPKLQKLVTLTFLLRFSLGYLMIRAFSVS